MNGFIRGLRHLFFITALFVLSTITFTSCSVFRTLGLYNVPPPYSESYEEYNGKPLLHMNKAENIQITLTSDKKSYYPSEPITLIYRIQNLSNTDTMGVNSPFYSEPPQLIVKNSSGEKAFYFGITATNCPYSIVDEYSRSLNVSHHALIPPNNEIEFTTRIDGNYHNFRSKIFDNTTTNEILDRAYGIQIKEFVPDDYKITCYVSHTEFDEVKGPQRLTLQSDTLRIEILKPTKLQIEQRGEYIQMMKNMEDLDDYEKTYIQFQNYVKNYPDGYYARPIKKLIEDKESLSSIMEFIRKQKNKGEL